MCRLKAVMIIGVLVMGWLLIPATHAQVSSPWLVIESAPEQAACGPGAHWIDNCPAGTDNLPSTTALVGIDFNNDCRSDQTITLTGPVVVKRAAGVPHKIDPTEITNMALIGGGLTLRVGVNTSGINPNVKRTFGAIVEQPNNPTLGDSFFDVFFEIAGTPAGNLYNQTSLRITAVIDRVPPRASYLHPTNLCLPLFTSPIPGQGTKVANLVEARHDVGVPTVTQWGLLALGLLLAGSLAFMIRRRFTPRPAGA